MQSSCALHVPHYTVQALRARGKRAVSRLTSRFRVTFYSRKVDLVCVYARRPRRTRRSHDCQRASRKLSVHAVILCASCTPHYCPGAMRPRKACSRLISRFRAAFYCRMVDLVCVYARRPRRTLRSHDCQRTSRKLSVYAAVLCASCTPLYCPGAMRPRKACSRLTHAFGLRSIVLGWTWCATSMASAAAARTATTMMHSPTHRRLRQALRRKRCTAPPRFTRPAWPRRALRSHDHQRAPRKPSVNAISLCSPCAYHASHYTAQALRAETAA
jgi:hypothetical protein